MKLKGQVLNLISPLCAKIIKKVWNYNRALLQNLQTWFSKATYLSSWQTHACIIQGAFTHFYTGPKLHKQPAHKRGSCTAHGGREQLVLIGSTGVNGHQLCSINYIYYVAALVPFPLPLSVKGQASSELRDFL